MAGGMTLFYATRLIVCNCLIVSKKPVQTNTARGFKTVQYLPAMAFFFFFFFFFSDTYFTGLSDRFLNVASFCLALLGA